MRGLALNFASTHQTENPQGFSEEGENKQLLIAIVGKSIYIFSCDKFYKNNNTIDNEPNKNIITFLVINFFFIAKNILEIKLNITTSNNGIVKNSPKKRIISVDFGG